MSEFVSKVDDALERSGEPDPRVVARRMLLGMTAEDREAALAWAFPLAVTVRLHQLQEYPTPPGLGA